MAEEKSRMNFTVYNKNKKGKRIIEITLGTRTADTVRIYFEKAAYHIRIYWRI